jgi:transposase
MEPAAALLPTLAHRVWLLPLVARRWDMEAAPQNAARPGAPSKGAAQAPNSGQPGRAEHQDQPRQRLPRLRPWQAGGRAQATPDRRHAGTASGGSCHARQRLAPASVSDTAGAFLVLAQLAGSAKKLRRLWVDGGYFNAAYEQAQRQGLRLQPVLRPPGRKGFVLLARRWVVERTFAWLSACRRLARDYETRTQSSETFILLAMTRIMINRLKPA